MVIDMDKTDILLKIKRILEKAEKGEELDYEEQRLISHIPDWELKKIEDMLVFDDDMVVVFT